MTLYTAIVEFKKSEEETGERLNNIREKRFPQNGLVEFIASNGDTYTYLLDSLRAFSMEREEEVGEETDDSTD